MPPKGAQKAAKAQGKADAAKKQKARGQLHVLELVHAAVSCYGAALVDNVHACKMVLRQ